MNIKRFASSTIAFVGITVVALGIWLNRYNVYDWLRLRNYSANPEIAAFVSTTSMNKYGQRLFYVNDPQLSDRDTFNQECKTTEQTIVLGCYDGRNIYIFNVNDKHIDGVEEVTAAHEMLHAAYQRLSSAEKKRVNALLEVAYRRVNDPKLNETIASYQKTEPGQQDNELHSILGTEYANLGPELEEYYKKYFTDRAKVVALATAYKQVFQDMETQVAKYDADLSLRKAEITRRETSLESQARQIDAARLQMDTLLKQGETRSYNSMVASFNESVNRYNSEVNQLKKLIDEYNSLVEARNSIAVEQQNLAQSIDSRVDAIKNN